MPGCVLPVTLDYALAWCQGRVHDKQLLLDCPLSDHPECVFFCDLPDLESYFDCVAACVYWRNRGAVCLIARTGTPTVRSHIIRFGGVPLWVEDTVPCKTRFFVPPAAFKKWLAHK